MTHPKMIFVSDDARLRDGKLDPTDREVMKEASADGKPFIMNSEEAMAMAEAEGKVKKRRPLDREFTRPMPIDRSQDPPGVHRLTPQDTRDLVGAAAETWKLFRDEASAGITDERAAFVRALRVDRKYTWRSVARACSTSWKTDWGSNQIAGMAICEAAAERVFEDYRKPPWN